MFEYGASLMEIDLQWTPGITMLMVRKIIERRKMRPGRKGDVGTMTETDLIGSGFSSA